MQAVAVTDKWLMGRYDHRVQLGWSTISTRQSAQQPCRNVIVKTSDIVVPKSGQLSPADEAKRLSYLKNTILPALWSHQSAAFVRELSVIKPREFDLDLLTINTKFLKNKYSSSDEVFSDFTYLFSLCLRSRTPDIKKAGKILLNQYNDKVRGYEKRFHGNESDTSADQLVNVPDASDVQECSKAVSVFLSEIKSVNNDIRLCVQKSSAYDPIDLEQLTQRLDINSSISEATSKPKPKPTWNCLECTFINGDELQYCQICETPKNFLDLLKTELNQCHSFLADVKKMKSEISAVSYPSNWSGSAAEDNGELRLISLKNDDVILHDVLAHAGFAISRLFAGYLGVRNLKVRRVENWDMYQVYAQRKATMEKKNGKNFLNERWLLHGTTTDCVDRICQYGFNRSYAGKNGTVIGRGVYFSSLPTTSIKFALPDRGGVLRILLCRVLTGFYTTGSPLFVEPPMKTTTERFDSVVENVNNPTTFVVFSDYQAYPEYELSFRSTCVA